MLADEVIKHLDVVEHVLPCGIACYVSSPPNPLPFQELEENLCDRVVMSVSMSAHAGIQIVFAEERLPLLAGVLGTLI